MLNGEMLMSDNIFRRNKAGQLLKIGLYDPSFEHDNCGVGFLAKLDGIPTHKIVEDAITVLVNLEHRGALGGDKSTGDGAGIMVQIPDLFLRLEGELQGIHLPKLSDYAVAMVFMPNENKLMNKCMSTFEKNVQDEGCDVLGWRKVPSDDSILGDLAKSTKPQFYQIFIHRGKIDQNAFERKLYVIRRLIEKEVKSWDKDTSQFYICSMSSSRIVYKGLLTAHQIPLFFPDLSDERFASSFGIIHQRYSTNTLPTWNLAQPFRFIAHNGEINTLSGNIHRMKARESIIKSELFKDDIEKIKPIIDESGSDSAIFDNVLELLVLGGRSLPHAMMMMIPEANGPRIQMSEDKRAFYEFHSAVMEPWDGPAAIAFSDARFIGGNLDRNGLRPSRYTITNDGIVLLASETGVLDFEPERIIKRSRLSPGKMLLVDLIQNRVVPDKEIKAKISRQKPYRRWIKDNIIELRGLFTPGSIPEENPEELLQKQHAFGYTEEELKMIITPMASRSQEAVGSMGNDTPLAILSRRPQSLFSYFKQRFAQVTNPPIDPLREELVMSLESFLGGEGSLLEEIPGHFKGIKLSHPILTTEDLIRIKSSKHPNVNVKTVDITFSADEENGLEKAIGSIFQQAKEYIKQGATILILSDRNISQNKVPIPSLLAVSGLHHNLIKHGMRNHAGIIIDSGEVREVIHFPLLLGYGADAICPYLAFSTIRNLSESSLLEQDLKPEEALDSYIIAVKKGFLKTMSRLGISTVHSFFVAQTFEAVGLSKELIDEYFSGTISRLGGLTLKEVETEAVLRHRRGFPEKGKFTNLLDVGGDYLSRNDGENHFWTFDAISKLQLSVRANDYNVFKDYTKTVNENNTNGKTLRGLLKFKERKSILLEEVEPVEYIIKRFAVSAMSFGSISKEAHETIAIAMNRIGARSNSGEGGEDMERNILLENGDDRRSKVKQIASGRFGVTAEYLLSADEIQIKIAQGAKPGEGGQLPGHKVSDDIAKVRHTTPGVTLISPPPHHDIYSIEDIAQLIYDLKCVNPQAKVSVKLVSETGVGTVAAGVAKAKADLVLISGYEGGTGASPLTAIRHTGIPWEIGLAETHQTLMANNLRDKIRVQVDGQIKTGRDIAVAALLGAEEFGFATSVLITIGCVMLRKCHLNTCSAGVATQDPLLRSRFQGKPEYVENFFKFLAQDLREIMAQLGFRTVEEMCGHTEILEYVPPVDNYKAVKLDLQPMLTAFKDEKTISTCCINSQDESEVFDTELIKLSRRALTNKMPVKIDLPIRNIHRTIGARLSGEIVRRYGPKGLPENSIKLNFRGSAGQSLGAFLVQGISIKVIGDANDYVGKGMSGGRIVLVPPENIGYEPENNSIVGNVVLYGATGGEIYLNGRAGERFAVRNSGAKAVVEGVGDHGCEYMTGGMVVVIGSTGKNFAAGMSGGIAYIYDQTQLFDTRCNLDMVDLESVWDKDDKIILREMVEKHYFYTKSKKAKSILSNWESNLPLFVKVIPIDYRKSLERMRLQEQRDVDTVAVTEEVFHG
jgi:glutamate synthase domain-containing protein 2/glutamate synthase domain-containing protein 1/glutamate synthase domain-containing protein 3